jgi:hypothetical protein
MLFSLCKIFVIYCSVACVVTENLKLLLTNVTKNAPTTRLYSVAVSTRDFDHSSNLLESVSSNLSFVNHQTSILTHSSGFEPQYDLKRPGTCLSFCISLANNLSACKDELRLPLNSFYDSLCKPTTVSRLLL